MSKIIFNEHQRRQIEANSNVASVSDRAIQYTTDFKLKAVLENLQGKGPAQIFREAGFDLEIIGMSLVKDMGLKQSMSRRGNCLDNAPMESFFGHLKDEVDYKEAESLAELHTLLMDYMNHYNNTRKQWTLKKMTPATYRRHLIAA